MLENKPKHDEQATDLLKSWADGKAELKKNTGFDFGIDYTTQLFGATNAPSTADDFSGGGIFRAYGRWEMVNPGESANNGSLNWKIENRHPYTDTAPVNHSLSLGHVGSYGTTFDESDFRLTNLYWRQSIGKTFIGYVGYLYTSGTVDAYELASPWSGFANYTFQPGSASIALPPDSAFGAMLGAWLSEEFYLLGTITDRNADPTDPFSSAESFFQDSEYFTAVEFGWTTSKVPYFRDNIHLTYWHVDESSATGAPDGWGLNFSAAYWIDKKFMPFVRAGYAEDAGSPSLLEKSVGAGVAFHVRDDKDLLGVGVNWGKPNRTTFGRELDDQVGAEIFYRTPVGKNLEVTPSVQLLFNPALRQDEDFVAVFGLRAKVAF